MVTTSPDPSRRGDLFDPACPTRRLLDRVSGKWVALLVKVLADNEPQELRFAELERRTPGVSHEMLSQMLQALVLDGLVVRRVEATTPTTVFYRLTPLGLSLDAALASLRDWAEEHMLEVDEEAAGLPGRRRDRCRPSTGRPQDCGCGPRPSGGCHQQAQGDNNGTRGSSRRVDRGLYRARTDLERCRAVAAGTSGSP